MLKYSKFIKLFESGNAIEDARPLQQDEVISTYNWVEKNIFPKLGLEGNSIDATQLDHMKKTIRSSDIDQYHCKITQIQFQLIWYYLGLIKN